MTNGEAIADLELIRDEMYDEEYGEQTEDSKKFQESLDMAIFALSAEGEYIKKEEFKSAIHNYFIGLNHNVTEEDIQAYIDALALYSFPDREKEGIDPNDMTHTFDKVTSLNGIAEWNVRGKADE